MSSQKYASPLRLKIFPSRILLTVVGLLHLGAIAVLLSASLPLWVDLTGSLLVTLSLLIGWSRAMDNWSYVARDNMAEIQRGSVG